MVIRPPVPHGEAALAVRLQKTAHLAQHGEHLAIACAPTRSQPGIEASAGRCLGLIG